MAKVLPSRSGAAPTWIFDLDSTLFCVSPRIRNIYMEFLRAHPKPQPVWERLLPRLTAATQRYDIAETFRLLLANGEVTGYETEAAELWDEFKTFWDEHFLSNRYLHSDAAYPHAAEFVHRVRAEGFEVVYLSARDHLRTAQGTHQNLYAQGFPMGEGTQVLLKSSIEETDLEFKKRATSVLRTRYDIKVFVDNEPENVVMAAEEFPHALIVFFHTVMSARMPTRDYLAALGGRPALRLWNYSLGQQ